MKPGSSRPPQPARRWAALDAVKTVTLTGTLLAHIVIWWFGEKSGPGAVFYALPIHRVFQLALVSVAMVMITASGAIFYFHLKRLAGFRALAERVAVLLAVALLLGLNLEPFGILWNVFGFYAVSILLMAFIQRVGGARAMSVGTAASLLLTPVLRRLLGESAGHHYLAAILVGSSKGLISYFPVFPWFFVLGVGFLTASAHEGRAFARAAFAVGALAVLLSAPFLPPLDLSDLFAVTSRIPLLYLLFFSGLFLVCIALAEQAVKEAPLSAFHPLNAIGRHMLAVYLITILAMLILTESMKPEGPARICGAFFALNALTLAVAYAAGCLLEYRRLRPKRGLSAV